VMGAGDEKLMMELPHTHQRCPRRIHHACGGRGAGWRGGGRAKPPAPGYLMS
jgi:hypothetical protein